MEPLSHIDVLVCGAGPVGILTVLGLAQQGISTLIIEKRERHVQETIGRACTLYPRTLELLEQLDVAEEVTRAAFIGRTYAVFRDGKRISRKAWQAMGPLMDNSFHNYLVNIRQRYSEDIFATKYKAESNRPIYYGWAITGYAVDTSLSDGHNVTAMISHDTLGKRSVRCKYLIGADGGSSTVRQLAGIAMEGNETTYKWIRIDGRMKTDMPDPNVVFGSLETQTHGNVLWCRLDRDACRIGFALTPSLQAKYPEGLAQEQAVSEAIDALQPFKLEIERVDWWTQYSVKQKIAETLQKDEYIFLAGDAAHTHSSAFAQGMNTGVHDATNLVWKLSGTLKGWYQPQVLVTYADERRAAVRKMISIDRLAAAAISGQVPSEFQAAGLTAEDAFHNVIETNLSFNVGLGISYRAAESSILSREPTATTLFPGMRSPDVLLLAPGPAVPMRLHSITHCANKGCWSVLVFTGARDVTRGKITALSQRLNEPECLLKQWSNRLTLSTIMLGTASNAWEVFDGPAVGRLYFDTQSLAHDRYGVYPENGAISVIRPDGVFAFAAGLDEIDHIVEFFRAIFN
ncbi:FAD binding domain-containing protein [Xylariaceae sp. FL1019]|nr:FAD binding domain-containing protein [Xylariaceae sp. FL1019]